MGGRSFCLTRFRIPPPPFDLYSLSPPLPTCFNLLRVSSLANSQKSGGNPCKIFLGGWGRLHLKYHNANGLSPRFPLSALQRKPLPSMRTINMLLALSSHPTLLNVNCALTHQTMVPLLHFSPQTPPTLFTISQQRTFLHHIVSSSFHTSNLSN